MPPHSRSAPHVSGLEWIQGYSIGSASLACFLLFGAFMDEFSEFSGKPFRTVDIAVPEVLIGGLLGVSSARNMACHTVPASIHRFEERH